MFHIYIVKYTNSCTKNWIEKKETIYFLHKYLKGENIISCPSFWDR